MIVSCRSCRTEHAARLGACPSCGASASREPAPATEEGLPRHFRPALGALAAALALGSTAVYVGWLRVFAASHTERVGAFVCAAAGLVLLSSLQVRISVTADEIRIRHLVFVRRVAIAQIAELVQRTDVIRRTGVETDRVKSATLRLQDGREISLRPKGSELEAMIEAIERARALRG